MPLASLAQASLSTDRQKVNHSRVYTAILFAFIVVFLLLLLLTGMNVYGAINSQRDASDSTRLALSLITNNVRMNDTADAVRVGTGPEGPALVLVEYLDTGAYETRIYAYQGMIVQEYAMAGSAYTPDRADPIVASKTFYFEYTNNLLTIHTDAGDACVMLHG
ncbi:MAG: DUF4860 domain-containing protein [Eggerthellaceae bacterium]|nr:DUF4860 domain-containing protein [Eggerthellaceae bacterium]